MEKLTEQASAWVPTSHPNVKLCGTGTVSASAIETWPLGCLMAFLRFWLCGMLLRTTEPLIEWQL
jgi:hypothetical protein